MCPLVLSPAIEGATPQEKFPVLVPFDAGRQDCRLACVFILSTLALIGVVLALGLRTLLKGCFCQAGWHLVCLYGIDTVFALAS